MSEVPFISYAEGEAVLDWHDVARAIEDGHRAATAQVEDVFLYREDDTMLSRAAWADGMGLAVKTATIFPGNAAAGKPAIGGAVTLFSDADGSLEAVLDFALVTKWKTAGDSLLAAMKLARADSREIVILGAGTVARSLREAYGAAFPDARFAYWNRTAATARALAEGDARARVADDLEAAVRGADIVASATMTTKPILRGDWLRPGTHVDLIGAYRPDMREADDTALTRSRLFVDSRATTMGHIGELKIPLAEGTIGEADIVADYTQMERFQRGSDAEITLFKNGGGAHMDLMVSRHILDAWRAAK